jgi:hypothetical protein
MRLAIWTAALAAVLLSACASTTGTGEPRATFGFGTPDVTMSGPAELMGWYDFERVDLVRLIDPENQRGNRCAAVATRDKGRCELDAAFHYFAAGASAPGANQNAFIQRRDAIQDRIMAASEQRCYAYRLQLTRNVSNTNFLLGSATTILAGAGAVFTDPATIRALSAAAGISNGISAEYQRSYLHTLTLQLITRGIEIRRRTIRNEIEMLRGSPLVYGEPFAWSPQGQVTTPTAANDGVDANASPRWVSEYTLERAVADALRYHGACTVLSGLEEANKLVENSQSTSLESLDASLQRTLSIVRRNGEITEELARQDAAARQRRQGQ